jgi:predicted RNA-binding Zn-ribbon protein involved in translation (DUF1610 family)
MSHMCPVCGYPGLDKPAYSGKACRKTASFETCPSCGFKFGYTDFSLGFSFEKWREHWFIRGKSWQGEKLKQPPNWNPRHQLLNIKIKVISHLCPVCGYPDLDKPAYRNTFKDGIGSLEICPSCGFQFGYTDDACHLNVERSIIFQQWRQEWISGGMKWSIKEIKPPANWNPCEQLLNVGVKAAH